MNYIKKYNVAIPKYRITNKVLHPRSPKSGQHSICYVDEDIITLAYQAGEKVIEDVDAVLFATTTPVFKGRYHASYLAELLGLKEGILAFDITTTSRSGTDALVLANGLLKSNSFKNVLIIASDIYYPAIGLEMKSSFGHAAVAMIISSEKGAYELKKANSYSAGMAEEFEYKTEKIKYDARFSKTIGFKKNLALALNEEKISPKSIDHVFLNSPYARLGLGLLKKFKFDLKEQLRSDSIVKNLGHTGAVHGLLTLIDSIENNSGTTILFDCLNGTNVIEICGNANSANSFGEKAASIENYQDYLTLRKQGKFESKGYRSVDIFSSEMITEREKDTLLKLKGYKCDSCGSTYYIKAARCNSCKSDMFTSVQLLKHGTVYSITSEYYYPSSFGPTNMVVIDLKSGGRITVQQTDDMFPQEENIIKIGDEVKLVLRKMMENDKKPNYFWKCVKV